MGTLATHSGRTFDSLPFVHIGQFMRKHEKTWYKWYNHVWPKTSKDNFPANTLLNSGCPGAMQTWELCIPGVPWVEVRFVTLESRPAKLRLAWVNWVNLCEPSAVHVDIFLHVVTAMNLWQFVDDKTAMHR